MLQRIVIPNLTRLPITMNGSSQNGRWATRKAKLAVAELVRQHSHHMKPATTPCQITYAWYVPNLVHRDTDGLGMFAKAATDQLVKQGILPDDWWKYLQRTILEIPAIDRDHPHITITLEDYLPHE